MSSIKHGRAKQRRAQKAAERRRRNAALRWRELSPAEAEAFSDAEMVQGFEGLSIDEAMAKLETEWGIEDEVERADTREAVRQALVKRDAVRL